MNQWQPMIDRCEILSNHIDMILSVRSFKSDFDGDFTISKIDDLETVLYALRYVANSLGSMKMGASQQGTLPNPAMKKTS